MRNDRNEVMKEMEAMMINNQIHKLGKKEFNARKRELKKEIKALKADVAILQKLIDHVENDELTMDNWREWDQVSLDFQDKLKVVELW